MISVARIDMYQAFSERAFMIIGTLMDAAGVFFNVKDVHDLIKQERLQTLIVCLRQIADVHIITAIEELQAMKRSNQPEVQCNRAIGHLKLAANSLVASQARRPVLQRWMTTEAGRNHQSKKVSLQITGCYLMIAWLYRSQQNIDLAKDYGAKAREAFKVYAAIRQDEIRGKIADQFVGTWSTEQAGGSFIINGMEPILAGYRVQFGVNSDQAVFRRLAEIEMDEVRDHLFGWLESL